MRYLRKLSNGLEKLAEALLKPINPATILLLGIYTFVWGWWVATPLWNVFTQAQLFGFMAMIAPEWFWGCLAISVGMVTIYGAVKRSYRAVVRGASVSGWHWLMIAVLYFMGDPLNTGGITSLFFALYSAYIYLNLRVNYRNQRDNPQILH